MALPIGTSVNPLPGYPLPVRKTYYPGSVPAPQETAITPVFKTSDVQDAEALLRQRQAHADWQGLPDQRARRALEAYGALQQIQQRDYVSQVLGIDEYV